MIYIPVLGRLNLSDYVRLLLAFLFLIFEPILRFIFAVLPLQWIVDDIRERYLHYPGTLPSNSQEGKRERIFLKLKNTEDFVQFWGFPFQSHYVTTRDGYILALHRIPYSRSEEEQLATAHPSLRKRRSTASLASIRNETSRPVVLLWHGFLMCSEVWVCTPDPSGSLAFTLAEAGYDVWMGNTRGNKYSCKHKKLKPTEEDFWDFSLDELALFDIPDAVDYILKVTGAPSLSYIAFSQGSSTGFASLSLNPKLNRKINLFVAMAPSTKPIGLKNKTIQSFIHTSPEVIYLLFGRKALLSSTLFWQTILTPPTFAAVIDYATYFLFSWSAEYLQNKRVVYRHLYSYSSVKIIVHWFQIMKSGCFQMYDEAPSVLPNSEQGHVVPPFPTNQIKTPVAILYGGKDTLPDISYIIRNGPMPVSCLEVKEFEHVHFLWGVALDKVVFPLILGLLSEYSEEWIDASTHSQDLDELNKARTVAWIPQSRIDRITCLSEQEIQPWQDKEGHTHYETASISILDYIKEETVSSINGQHRLLPDLSNNPLDPRERKLNVNLSALSDDEASYHDASEHI